MNGANTAVESQSATAPTNYYTLAKSSGVSFLPSDLPVGMFINDLAVDRDTGDAYFTDSFNCRENLAPHFSLRF